MLRSYQTYLDATVIPMRLACVTRSGWPFVLSLWYLYRDGALYCATQSTAKIIPHLRNDPRCAFEIAADLPPYCGIRGQAEATLLPEQGGEILAALLNRYLGTTTNSLAQNLLKRQATEVAIRLEPTSVYTWDFSDRMRDAHNGAIAKICP